MNRNYWTYEKCLEEALKYTTRSKFQQGSCYAYSLSLKKKWIDCICSHMTPIEKVDIYTKEYCQTEALKYETRTEFKVKSNLVYNKARWNNWLDSICSHMKTYRWTYDKCKNLVSNYTIKQEFRRNYDIVYNVIIKNDWKELLSHLIDQHVPKDRLIYVYEFEDKSVYVGLTGDSNDRTNRHKNDTRSVVNEKMCDNFYIKFEYKELTEYVDENEASRLEKFYTEQYKNAGWSILNKAKAGSLGGSIFKWKNKELCKNEALKYNKRSEFKIGSSGAYKRSIVEGWLDEICSHMTPKPIAKPSGYWNYDTCLEVALKCSSRTEFCNNYLTAYRISIKNDWIEMFSHMKRRYKSYWEN